MDFAPLPPAPDVPPTEAIADAIAAGFPEASRARARAALATEILPWDLRGLATFPRPRRLVEVAYENLTERLAPIAADARLATLEVIVCERRSARLLGDALGLGVARWLLEHPDRKPGEPWLAAAAPFAARDRAAVIAEAERRLAELDALGKAGTAECREAMRLDLVHARLALAAARTGGFGTSSGPFVDFLRDVGEPVQDLGIH